MAVLLPRCLNSSSITVELEECKREDHRLELRKTYLRIVFPLPAIITFSQT